MIAITNSLLNPRRAAAFRKTTVGDFLNAIDTGLTDAGYIVSDVCETSFVVTSGDVEFHVEFEARGASIESPPDDFDEYLGYPARRPAT